jgi:predicted Fe-S protein YdhL (DUF1289 family)
VCRSPRGKTTVACFILKFIFGVFYYILWILLLLILNYQCMYLCLYLYMYVTLCVCICLSLNFSNYCRGCRKSLLKLTNHHIYSCGHYVYQMWNLYKDRIKGIYAIFTYRHFDPVLKSALLRHSSSAAEA